MIIRCFDSLSEGFRKYLLLNSWRKLGDSNPRYGYPYDSLANCWFQPLTQTSKFFMTAAIVLELRCKDKSYFLINNTFGVFFRKKDTNFVAESENQFIKYI